MESLSLVIICKNEEKNIERCIRSVPFAKEVVVLDSGSTDRTVDIARRLGARVFVEPWRGYHQQKVRATALAHYQWVLSLDADEALSDESAKEVAELLAGTPSSDAYSFPRLSFHLGRWIHHGGWHPDRQVRLFNRTLAQWQEGHVHEKISAKTVGLLTNHISHWVFTDLADQVDTNNNYSSLGAKDLVGKGVRFRIGLLLIKPIGKFFETYVWKQGYRDGMPGFVIAVGAAYSMFLKYAKLWEIERLASAEARQKS